MIKFHPDQNMLAEYAAGTLDWALCLGVAAHLHFCLECRRTAAELNLVGGALLTDAPAATVKVAAFADLMAKIQNSGVPPSGVPPSGVPPSGMRAAGDAPLPPHPSDGLDPMLTNLPKVVGKLLPRQRPLRWLAVSTELRMARLVTGQDKYEVALQRICSGGKVPQHDHRGLEVTLVLKGSFSDDQGVYRAGDFLLRQPGEVHRPTAAQNEDCLCFSVSAAPVRLTGVIGRLLNPFLTIRPA